MEFIRPYQKALSASSTDTSFASRIPTTTAPANAIVLGDQSGHGEVPCEMNVVFYGAGNDDQTFEARIIGWKRIRGNDQTTPDLWVPTVIAQFACILSTAVGVAGAPVVNTDRFVDTLSLASTVIQPKTTDTDSAGAASTGGVWFTSPANNLIAHANLRVEGYERVEFTFDMTGATNGNALVSFR